MKTRNPISRLLAVGAYAFIAFLVQLGTAENAEAQDYWEECTDIPGGESLQITYYESGQVADVSFSCG